MKFVGVVVLILVALVLIGDLARIVYREWTSKKMGE